MRKEYWRVLQKIDVTQIYILTHAYYGMENLSNIEIYPEVTADVIENQAPLDNLSVFDFKEIISTNEPNLIDEKFLNTEDLSILLKDMMLKKQ